MTLKRASDPTKLRMVYGRNFMAHLVFQVGGVVRILPRGGIRDPYYRGLLYRSRTDSRCMEASFGPMEVRS